MSSWFHRKNAGFPRAIATMAAVLVLFAQLVGAVHFHQSVASQDGTSYAEFSADQGLCPVCQLAFHSPGSVAAAPTISRGPAIVDAIIRAHPVAIESPVFGAERGRAPPVLS